MALIVEDGTGLTNANAYVSIIDFEAYCDLHGLDIGDNDEEPAVIRATQWIDSFYRGQFAGYRKNLRAQSLEWPRYGVIDRAGFYVDPNALPKEIVQATCEAAWRETVAIGTLMPDLDRGGFIKELQAGSARIVYGSNAPVVTTFNVIDGILSALLGPQHSMFSAAVRA